MSRQNFTRAAFRSILAGLPSRPMFGGPGDEPVPHGDDWVHGGGDTRDYAAWIDRRVDETAADFGRAQASLIGPTAPGSDYNPTTLEPSSPRAIGFYALRQKWLDWEYRWKQFLETIEDSWWTRQLAWEQLEGDHAELLEFRRRLGELGIVSVRKISDVPKGPKPVEQATGLITAAGIVLIGIAGIMAVKELRR